MLVRAINEFGSPISAQTLLEEVKGLYPATFKLTHVNQIYGMLNRLQAIVKRTFGNGGNYSYELSTSVNPAALVGDVLQLAKSEEEVRRELEALEGTGIKEERIKTGQGFLPTLRERIIAVFEKADVGACMNLEEIYTTGDFAGLKQSSVAATLSLMCDAGRIPKEGKEPPPLMRRKRPDGKFEYALRDKVAALRGKVAAAQDETAVIVKNLIGVETPMEEEAVASAVGPINPFTDKPIYDPAHVVAMLDAKLIALLQEQKIAVAKFDCVKQELAAIAARIQTTQNAIAAMQKFQEMNR